MGGADVPVIRTNTDYEEVLRRAQAASGEPLTKYDAGQQLEDADIKKLREGAAMFEALAAFDPNKADVRFATGRVYEALGNDERALSEYKAFLRLSGEPKTQMQVIDQAAAHLWSSRAHFRLRDYKNAAVAAEAAVSLVPSSAINNWAAASAYAEMGENQKALAFIDASLELDPNLSEAKLLKKMLLSEKK